MSNIIVAHSTLPIYVCNVVKRKSIYDIVFTSNKCKARRFKNSDIAIKVIQLFNLDNYEIIGVKDE